MKPENKKLQRPYRSNKGKSSAHLSLSDTCHLSPYVLQEMNHGPPAWRETGQACVPLTPTVVILMKELVFNEPPSSKGTEMTDPPER